MHGYGLLFRVDGELFLGKYGRDGKVDCFRGLTNPDAYNAMQDNSLAVVEWWEDATSVKMRDLQRIYLEFDKIEVLLENKQMFHLAEQIYDEVVSKVDF